MSLLIVVETHDLAHVLLVSSLLLGSEPRRVDSRGQVGGILGFFEIPPALVVLLLFILLGFIGRLGILGGNGCGSGCRALGSLGVITAMIIQRFLSLDFVRGSVSQSIPLETTQISLSHVKTRA